MKLYLYHVSQTQHQGYETYSDFVVCCESEEEAPNTHPSGNEYCGEEYGCWCDKPEDAKVKYIGEAAEGLEKGVICYSYHSA